MYLLKKILSQFFMPLTAVLLIAVSGLYLLHFTRKQKTGKRLVTISILILLILSFLPVSDLILRPLEYHHKPHLKVDTKLEKTLKYVVVLAGGHTSDENIPVTSQINSSSLVRLAEGIRLINMYPDSKLVLSGGKTFDPVSEAEILKKVALQFGVEPRRIITESGSVDTETQAEKIKELVKSEKFILVTSANHLPRSVLLFKKNGMNPVPAPAGLTIRKHKQYQPTRIFPNAVSLVHIDAAIHEYLGIIWSKLRGKI
ncbi:envelope biogenesis factor ElyC [bacterium]|nr:envelope biogenesis factor ElyC [bacterium]